MRRIHAVAFLFLWIFLTISPHPFFPQQRPREWADEFNKLAQAIYKKEPEPRFAGVVPPFELYIEWLGRKAEDRDKVQRYLSELSTLSTEDPANSEIRDWIIRFRELLTTAQESGESTTERALGYLKIEGKGWKTCQEYADELIPLYAKASETAFAPDRVREFAQCLLRYATRDYECSYYSAGLYRDCVDPSTRRISADYRDGISLDERCPRRESDVEHQGDPQQPADDGLEFADWIRESCDLWGFSRERSDVTDLMESYYKDVLCKFPAGEGHKWYLELAKEYKLDEAVDYNEGFYATIKGKVEILTDEGKKPAPGAKVRVYAPLDDQEWETTADGDGKYKIEDCILHKDCSPFDISAEYKEHEEETQYEGPLEEPDESYEYEKDLLIKPNWKGTIESTYEMRSDGDQSLISAILLDEGEFEGKTNWKMDVVFKFSRGNDRVRIYDLKSVRFEFLEKVEGKLELEEKDRRVTIDGKDDSRIRSRQLLPSECDLRLRVNLRKKTYTIEGLLRVLNIPSRGEGRLQIDVEQIQKDEKDSEEGIEEYEDQILIEGEYKGDFPWVLVGTSDELEKTAPEFREFLKDMAGEVTYTIKWKLDRKGK